ncbi:MAG: hypothetical protein MUO31_05470 [Thermodesulfovibrionales bacterium]|nr:hypothetical protein [Thermodesulfovibrionales bacterium]
MDKLFAFVLITIVLVVILTLFISFQMKSIETEVEPIPLLPFSADISFDPFPSTLVITNEHPCTGVQLRKCKISDPFSCIGCQSLIARCTHLANETEFIDAGSSITTTIPANTEPDDGYCLTIAQAQDVCNPFHGNLALVQLEPNLPDTILICNCTAPGLIGNTGIFGSCSTAFVCDGRIDNIDQPLDDIKCICNTNSISTKLLDGTPTCNIKTVRNAQNDGTLSSLTQYPIGTAVLPNVNQFFNITIQQNIPGLGNLINPCAFCPVTNAPIPNWSISRISERHCTCSVNFNFLRQAETGEYFGIPYRRSQQDRVLAGPTGPDAVLGVWWEEVLVYTRLENFIQRLVFIIDSRLNGLFYQTMGLDLSRKYAINVDDVLMGLHLPLPPLAPASIPGSICLPLGLNYHCEWYPRRQANTGEQFVMNDVQPISAGSNYIHRVQWRGPPGVYLWGTDLWWQYMGLNDWAVQKASPDGPYITYAEGFTQGTGPLARYAEVMVWGFKNSGSIRAWELTLYNTGHFEDWQLLQSRLIEPN